MRRRKQPVELPLGGEPRFPDPNAFDAEGLVAFSGDLSPQTLLAAYGAGIFPWYSEETVPLWWSPDPRALLTPDRLHVSRSLLRTMRRGSFVLTWNRSFQAVKIGRAHV